MNATEYSFFLHKPNSLGEKNGLVVDKIVSEFPYFQSARVLQLKYLYNQNSFRYSAALKKTAAYTADRSVLFAFITSQTFTGVQTKFLKEKSSKINNIVVNYSETIAVLPEIFEEKSKIEQSILTSIYQANSSTSHQELKIEIAENLNVNQPLALNSDEKHSFREWLQLSQYQPINRKEKAENSKSNHETELDKKSKVAIIDKFIEANPKLNPVSKNNAFSPLSNQIASDNSTFMTETLAKVYLEQKKYQKAIQAYEILILKYPEKSSFFANQISNIKIIQQNNI